MTSKNVRKPFDISFDSSFQNIKIYLKTFGCSHNFSDSEYMAGILEARGFTITDDFKNCDIIIINSCTVKSPSQASFINLVKDSKKINKKIVVAGCVPQADRTIQEIENCSIVGVSQIDNILEVIESLIDNKFSKLLDNKALPSLLLPKKRRYKYIEIIPISQGCLGSCTYCKTKHARGKLISYPIKDVVQACKHAWESGAKEIWITSEDTAVYGRDLGTNLPTLLINILKYIPQGVMIRIGMANPPYILEHVNEMIKILKHPNVYSFIHIPVQSGSNAVLDKMLREYTIEEFEFLCDYFLKYIPDLTIATDIICGFATETKENFEETLELIRKYKFPVINISQFYPRPGTVAAKWKKIDTKEVHRRSKELAELFKSYENYDKLLNTTQRIYLFDTNVEEKNTAENFMVGHTKSYVKVLIKKDDNLLGKEVIVKVTKVFKWHVIGEVIDRNPKSEFVDYNEYFKEFLWKKIENNKEKITSKKIDLEYSNIYETFYLKEKGTSNKTIDFSENNLLPNDFYDVMNGSKNIQNNNKNENKIPNTSINNYKLSLIKVGTYIIILLISINILKIFKRFIK